MADSGPIIAIIDMKLNGAGSTKNTMAIETNNTIVTAMDVFCLAYIFSLLSTP